jgi:YfiR/HmsC-like
MLLTRRRFVAAVLCWQAVPAPAQAPDDARVKAQIALTLARFTQWSPAAFAAPTDALTICVMHRSEPLAEAFAELGGKAAAGRPVKVTLNPEKLPGSCQVLFIHESSGRAGAAALSTLADSPILTVGDAEGFAARGGMVELVNVNDAIKLDVNLKALRSAQLGLSSQVLKLARQVRE